MSDDATPAKVRLTDGLGPAPERAEFEAWKRKQGGHYMSRNNEPGSDLTGYQDAHTQGQWEAWQAARAAERGRWRAAAEYAAHQLEQARIWGGMEWHYNPLHPLHYRSALERLRDVLRA